MRPPFWILLALFPLAVQAQTLTLTIGDSSTLLDGGAGSAAFINASQCGDNQVVTYTSTATSACSALTVWLTAGASCGTGADAGDLTIGTVAAADLVTTPTGTFSFDGAQLPDVLNGDAGCGVANATADFLVCGSFGYSGSVIVGGTCSLVSSTTLPTFEYDSQPPGIPILNSVDSLDSALSINYSADDDTAALITQIRAVPDGSVPLADGGVGYADGGPLTTGDIPWENSGTYGVSGAISINDLVNDQTYEVQIAAQDDALNVSGFSNIQSGTPQALYGFFQNYIAAGGTSGGCSSFGGGPLWLAAVMPALYSLLRRRR